jgi:hypothetical protein
VSRDCLADIPRIATGAFINIAVTVVPFVIIGMAVKILMKCKVLELSDVQRQAGPNRKPRKVLLLGSWRAKTEALR